MYIFLVLASFAVSSVVPPETCDGFASVYDACGGEGAIACNENGGSPYCSCDGPYRMQSRLTATWTACAQYPATIMTVFPGPRGIRRFNPREKNDVLQTYPTDRTFQELIIEAFQNTSETNLNGAKTVYQLSHDPRHICGPTAVYMSVVLYQFNGIAVGYDGPVPFDDWNVGQISPWQRGPRLGDAVTELFGPQDTGNAVDSWFPFVRCGCLNDDGEIDYIFRDNYPQRLMTCRNYELEETTTVQLSGDRITDLAGATARTAEAQIPLSAVPFIDDPNVRSTDLGAKIVRATCQRNALVRTNAHTKHEPTCDWVKEIYDMQQLREINVVDTWCEWFEEGTECLKLGEVCGAGASHAVAICPYDKYRVRDNGLFSLYMNCSVTCKCQGDDVFTGTQLCNAYKRPCREDEVDVFCPPGTCGEPDQPCKSCTALQDVLHPEVAVLKPGTCSAPSGYEWIAPGGCTLKEPFKNCTVGVASPGCPVDEVLAHVCGPWATGCVRECVDTDCQNKCVCTNDLRTYYPDKNSPDDDLRYTSDHACAAWPQTIASLTYFNDGQQHDYEVNTTFMFATDTDLDGVLGFESAMLSALEDAGLPIELETYDNITLLCGERAYGWSVVDYRASEELSSTYYDWRFEPGPGDVGPALPQKNLRLEDDAGVTHLTFIRCECLDDTQGAETFSVWQDNVIQWRYRCDTWEDITPPDAPDACPMVNTGEGYRVCNGVGTCDEVLPPLTCTCPGKWFGEACHDISDTGGEGSRYTKADCPTSGDDPLLCFFVDPCGEGCSFDHVLDTCVCESDLFEPIYLAIDNEWVRRSVCWEGETTLAIDGVNPCENNGECRIDPDTARAYCECELPWAGRYCKSSTCPGEYNGTVGSSCTEHGECRLNSTSNEYYCQCRSGWIGDQCDVPWCEGECGSGECVFQEEYSTSPFCTCDDGFVGLTCDTEVYAHINCSGTGTWDGSSGECVCAPGYRGVHCEIQENTNTTCGEGLCNNGGYCMSAFPFGNRPASMVCECYDFPGNDDITAPRQGTFCTIEPCPLAANGEICNGTAFCQADGTCSCNGEQDPYLWLIDSAVGTGGDDDFTAFAASASLTLGNGPACDLLWDICLDRPPANGTGSDRVWEVSQICGGLDAGFCSPENSGCVCFDGYVNRPLGASDTCKYLTVEYECETGVFNETSLQCDCPDVWGGISCNNSLCLDPYIPHIVDDEWRCRCPDVLYDWKFECTSTDCEPPIEFCTHLTCPYIEEKWCGGWRSEIPIPLLNTTFWAAGFNEEGVSCNASQVCNCSTALYAGATEYGECVPKWNMINLVGLVADDPTDINSNITAICAPGWDPAQGCWDRLCEEGAYGQTDRPGCESGCCCNNGWTGATCQEPEPVSGCVNQEIGYNDRCYCPSAYSLESDCAADQCSNQSTLVSGECVCNDDWTGPTCYSSSCWNGGYLNDDGCKCFFPFSGALCMDTSTLAPSTLAPTATKAPTSPPTTPRPTFPFPVAPTPAGDGFKDDVFKALTLLLMCVPFLLFRYSI